MAGACRIELQSKVLETFILTVVLRPFMVLKTLTNYITYNTDKYYTENSKYGTVLVMHKNKLNSPVIIGYYGMPSSGKTLLSDNLSSLLGMAHVSSERLRFELFEDPRYDKTEQQIITQLMNYMTEQFIKSGVSVVYDISLSRNVDRKHLKDLARKLNAHLMLVWLQIDIDSAWARSKARDKRKPEDKYAAKLTQDQFKQAVKIMQNPTNEEFLVVSGKHLFASHKQAILRRLADKNLLNLDSLQPKIAKPELTNLVSRAQAQAGRVDMSRRDIRIM